MASPDGRACALAPTKAPMCKACRVESADEPVSLICGHIWCKKCLNRQLHVFFEAPAPLPPRSPKCCGDKEHDLELLKEYLDEEVKKQVAEKGEEWLSRDRTYCCNRRCSRFLGQDQISGQWATCQTCDTKTCVECKEPFKDHLIPSRHPEKYSTELLETVEEEGWKICPYPLRAAIVDKIEGCNHILCICGQEWCWDGRGPEYFCSCPDETYPGDSDEDDEGDSDEDDDEDDENDEGDDESEEYDENEEDENDASNMMDEEHQMCEEE